ncbi:MAG: MFS transporter [Dehalococcoidia bacterium]|nr:MFS transporter [Dehalococcoidia bacterium]
MSDVPANNNAATTAQGDEEQASARAWIIFGLLSAIGTVGSTLSVTFGIMLPEIRKEIDISPIMAGTLTYIFMLYNAVTAIPLSTFFSRFNPVRLVMISTVVGAAFVVLQGFAASLLALAATRILFVAVSSVNNPSRTILTQQWFPLRQISTVNGIGLATTGASQAIVVAVTPFLMAMLGGWRPVFWLVGAWTAVMCVLWVAFARQRRTEAFEQGFKAQNKPPFRAIWKYKWLFLVVLGMWGAGVPWSAVITFFPTLLKDQRGISLASVGIIFSAMYAAWCAGSLLAGYADRYIPRRVIVAGSGVLLTTCHLLMLFAGTPWVIVVLGAGVGIGWIMTPIIQTLPYYLPGVKPREVAVLASFVGMGVGLGLGTGGIIAGVIIQVTGSVLTGLLVVSFLPLLMVVVGVVYPFEQRAKMKQPQPA